MSTDLSRFKCDKKDYAGPVIGGIFIVGGVALLAAAALTGHIPLMACAVGVVIVGGIITRE